MKGEKRVNRGGSWYNTPQFARVAYRSGLSLRGSNLGVRLARDPIHKLARAVKDEDED